MSRLLANVRPGNSWFVKRAAAQRNWRAEVHAYQAWVPAPEGRAPRLHAACEDSRALILSAVPGAAPRHKQRGALRQAGRLLRQLHEVEVRQIEPFESPKPLSHRLERLLSRNGGLFTAEQAAFARASAKRATSLPRPPLVACHGDYKVPNWLLDDAAVLRVIDFGEATLHRAAFDFTKLFYGAWWDPPRSTAAFFKGYGRRPDADEMEFIQCRMAVSAVAEVCFGRNRDHLVAERHGLSRLAALMAGHQVKVDASNRW